MMKSVRVPYFRAKQIIASEKLLNPIYADGIELPQVGESQFLPSTGAKLYHTRYGTWVVSGYAQDGSDVDRVLAQ